MAYMKIAKYNYAFADLYQFRLLFGPLTGSVDIDDLIVTCQLSSGDIEGAVDELARVGLVFQI
jgi:hypothetical protein